MFSQRLPENLEPNEYSKLLARKRASGARILDLTESNPTKAGIPYPKEEILAALSDSRSLVYEPTPLGLRAAREAVAAYYADRGEVVDPNQIVLTASTSEAYAELFQLLAEPGGRFLVPSPSYPLLDLLAGLASVCLHPYPLEYKYPNLGYIMGHAEIAKECRTKTVSGLILVSPNNPTGTALRTVARDEFVRVCSKTETAIICDEVFSDYLVEPIANDVVRSMVSTTDALCFTLSGLSKVCGLPQLKLGWIVVTGPPWEKAAALQRLELIADTYLSVGTPVQHATARLLGLRRPIQQAIKARIYWNAGILNTAAGQLKPPRVTVLSSDGGWYAVLSVPKMRTDEDWVLTLLEEDDVHVQPGYFFGFPTEAFLVVSLLTREDIFAEGIDRLLARVAQA